MRSSGHSGARYVYHNVDEDFRAVTCTQQRARAYLTHNEPIDTPLIGRNELGCNCFSSGESTFTENIMPRAYKSMLAYFQLMNDVPGYYETEIAQQADETGRYVTWEEQVQVGVRAETPRAA